MLNKYLDFDKTFSLEKIINNEDIFYFVLKSDKSLYKLDFSQSSVVFLGTGNTELPVENGLYYEDDESFLKKMEADSNYILSLANYKKMVVKVNNAVFNIVLFEPPVLQEFNS